MGAVKRQRELDLDVAVIGGGLAGICAAVASARHGARTVLVQDRPVLGGNSSSEIRVHVNGVTHLKPGGLPERETGIIEEILLHNRFHNPQEAYPVWDHVLYDFVTREPGLELLLNTQAVEAILDGDRIAAARCWQLTTETEITIGAKLFCDCSGDGLLAADAGAEFRTGREAAAEFGEQYAPAEADGWQMGASILLSAVDMGQPMPYEPPSFALKYDAAKSDPRRKIRPYAMGIWWIELGSEHDIIAEQELNRHKLMGYLHGVWDYIKNSGEFPEAETYALDWVGALPGRRESRRFIGDFILSERDLVEHRHFDDAVAFGGWSLDEHCPGGIENLADPPSYFHLFFAEVYEIPFRSLYSKNIENLFFAGRNISQTHIALSSSRVMATCATMGQAIGTAAAMASEKGISPRAIAQQHVDELQERLLRDDAFIPNRVANDDADLARQASRITASSTASGNAELLTDGVARDFAGVVHHWESEGLPSTVQLEWDAPIRLGSVELKCDTNLKRNILMRKDSKVNKAFWNDVPPELLRAVSVEALVGGRWTPVGSIAENRTRLIRFRFEPVNATAVRITSTATHGHPTVKLFEVRCYGP